MLLVEMLGKGDRLLAYVKETYADLYAHLYRVLYMNLLFVCSKSNIINKYCKQK